MVWVLGSCSCDTCGVGCQGGTLAGSGVPVVSKAIHGDITGNPSGSKRGRSIRRTAHLAMVVVPKFIGVLSVDVREDNCRWSDSDVKPFHQRGFAPPLFMPLTATRKVIAWARQPRLHRRRRDVVRLHAGAWHYRAPSLTDNPVGIGQSRGGGASRVLCYDSLAWNRGELESAHSGESEEGNPGTAVPGFLGGGR